MQRRARQGPCRFTLLVPRSPHGLHRVVDPEDHGHAEALAMIEHARPLPAEAARGPVQAIVGSHDPLAAVEDGEHVRERRVAQPLVVKVDARN